MFLTTDRLSDEQAERVFKDRIEALHARFQSETDVLALAQITSEATDGAFSHDECLGQFEHYERLTGRRYVVPNFREAVIRRLVRVALVPNIRIRHALEKRTGEHHGTNPFKVGGVDLRLARHFFAARARMTGGKALSDDGVRKRLVDLDRMFGMKVHPETGRVSLFTEYDDMLAMSRALGLDPFVVGV